MSALGNERLLTLGVEEEFHLVDLRTRQITPRASELLSGLSESTRTYAAELQQTVVETNSEVCDTLGALRNNLLELRRELVSVAGGRARHRDSRGRHHAAVDVRGDDHRKSTISQDARRLSAPGSRGMGNCWH